VYVNKLEKAYFYNSSHRNVVADISWLIEKLFKEKNRILVCCEDQETVEVIDAFLWAYKQEEFIPHSIATKEKNSIYPILITTDIHEDYDHNVLLALSGVLIKEKDWRKFAKVYYFFDDQENKEKENAREMWKNFSALNIVCKYWVNKANKWVLARSS
jgi:DNA polymerase IIIc chi subunit